MSLEFFRTPRPLLECKQCGCLLGRWSFYYDDMVRPKGHSRYRLCRFCLAEHTLGGDLIIRGQKGEKPKVLKLKCRECGSPLGVVRECLSHSKRLKCRECTRCLIVHTVEGKKKEYF